MSKTCPPRNLPRRVRPGNVKNMSADEPPAACPTRKCQTHVSRRTSRGVSDQDMSRTCQPRNLLRRDRFQNVQNMSDRIVAASNMSKACLSSPVNHLTHVKRRMGTIEGGRAEGRGQRADPIWRGAKTEGRMQKAIAKGKRQMPEGIMQRAAGREPKAAAGGQRAKGSGLRDSSL